MTDIPGTRMPSSPTVKPQNASNLPPPLVNSTTQKTFPELQVVNIEDAKKAKKNLTKEIDPFEGVRYQTLNWWMSFGAMAGVLVVLLGLLQPKLFILAPLGPTLGAVSWFVRKYVRKYGKHVDAFS